MKAENLKKGGIVDLIKMEALGGGQGLLGHEVRYGEYAEMVDEAILKVAADDNYTELEMFIFLDSRSGRFCGDRLTQLTIDHKGSKKALEKSLYKEIRNSITGAIEDLFNEDLENIYSAEVFETFEIKRTNR